MPYAFDSMPAVADKDIIYVIGGNVFGSGIIANVESYNTTTDTWTEEASLPAATAWQSVGLLGAKIVAADGDPLSGDNEGYNVKKNTWAKLAADPTARYAGCFSVIKGELYVAGGWNGTTALSVSEAYSAKTNSWTTLASMPESNGYSGSAEVGGRLYCFGGNPGNQTSDDYVQIYQP
jgi:influenza virus NS1A-binding protein